MGKESLYKPSAGHAEVPPYPYLILANKTMFYENKTHSLPNIIMIAAVDARNGLGRGGKIPWSVGEDRSFFKETTYGHALIMGRRTYESLGAPGLTGRRIGVLTHRELEGASCVRGAERESSVVWGSELKELLLWSARNEGAVFIAGGASVYEQAMPLADEILLSRIEGDYGCDVFFPDIDEGFELSARRERATFVLETYLRVTPSK